MTHNTHIDLWQNRNDSRSMRVPHTTSTPSTSTCGGFTGLRGHIKPPYTEEAIDEDSEEDVIEDMYDVAIRDDTQLQRAPLQRYVVRYSNGIICYPFGIKYVY